MLFYIAINYLDMILHLIVDKNLKAGDKFGKYLFEF